MYIYTCIYIHVYIKISMHRVQNVLSLINYWRDVALIAVVFCRLTQAMEKAERSEFALCKTSSCNNSTLQRRGLCWNLCAGHYALEEKQWFQMRWTVKYYRIVRPYLTHRNNLRAWMHSFSYTWNNLYVLWRLIQTILCSTYTQAVLLTYI